MHIPDGYLSPTTCTTLFATSAPFLYVALRKVKRQLHSRFLPLISVFSAFSFVIMMFNLPLPGGTTGHATGVGVAAVVLGPWAGMLAISIALLIQALFFGDGGITALGANCFNMAVAGCLVASFLYWLIARHAPASSPRRVVAAAIAGYCAINAAALLTAIEFGIQPLLFHDAAGAPLYAPYPLSVAIPAMMLGHLTFAGFAELIVSGGVVAYLQKTNLALLSRNEFGATISITGASAHKSMGKLWASLALLMILTPIGLLSVGSAWGEWAPQQFKSIEGRARIAQASQGIAPPAMVPSGLHRLSSFWTAPIPDYAPPVLKNASFGYVLSAMVGAGLVILVTLLTGWASSRFARSPGGNAQHG